MALAVALASACAPEQVTVEFYVDEGYTFSRAEQRTIASIAKATIPEVRGRLPTLPQHIVVKVRPWKKVTPEIGNGGTWSPPNVVYWTVDPDYGDGPAATARQWLRAVLYHELHHLVRRGTVPRGSLTEIAVTEGLAIVFERDETGVTAPGAHYPDNVAEWTAELMAQPPTADQSHWMSRHPDGRRRVGYKVGTYLVECAQRASGRSAADLVTAPTAEVIDLARQRCPI